MKRSSFIVFARHKTIAFLVLSNAVFPHQEMCAGCFAPWNEQSVISGGSEDDRETASVFAGSFARIVLFAEKEVS
jgi:hypothetical protein